MALTLQRRDYWPTQAWKTSEPEQQGMRSELLAEIRTFAQDTDPPISGVGVIRHGYLVYEQYFRGFHEHSYHTINSVTKSVTSALVGIALDRGQLTSLDQPLSDFFPETQRPGVDPRVRTISLRQLLSMTTGWAPNPFELAEFGTHPALVDAALQRPMAPDPGSSFWYDNLGAHLASVLLSRVSSMSTAQLAQETLLGPIGIWTGDTPRFLWRSDPDGLHNFHRFALWDEATGLPWKVDPSGHTTGYAGLHLTVREMAKLGYLYLNEGAWDGTQLIPPDYLRESIQPQSAGGPPEGTPYGYFWWIRAHDANGTFFALGAGGQRVYVVPRLDLVMAIASGPADPALANQNVTPNRAGDILDRFVIPAVR